MKLNNIQTILLTGGNFSAFRDPNTLLRIVKVTDKKGNLVGYGQHPHIEDALTHANISTGKHLSSGNDEIEISDFYGNNGMFHNYLHGVSNSNTQLDQWVNKGGKIEIAQSAPSERNLNIQLVDEHGKKPQTEGSFTSENIYEALYEALRVANAEPYTPNN